jgi:hypothetical protein
VRLLYGVRPHTVLVHGERHERHAKASRDALDESVGQSFDAATSARRNDRRQCRRDALPATGGENDLLGLWV